MNESQEILISVILPIYNVGEYISKCLDSIINQSYKNIEIICVNDFSDDNCQEIIEKYKLIDNRITLINNLHNVGPGLSRNIGLEVATGDYIHFIDPDDWIEEGCYENLISELKKYRDLDVLFFRYKRFNNMNNDIEEIEYRNKSITNRILNPIKNAETFDNWDRYCWQKLHRHDFLIENNIRFNNFPTLEDVEHAAQVYTKAKSIVYLDKSYIYYRHTRKGSLVALSSKNIPFIIESFYRTKNLYKELPDNIKYKLMGFDFYLIKFNIEYAYNKNYINIFDVLKFFTQSKQKDILLYKSYDLLPYEKDLRINPLKIFLKKNFPILFSKIIYLKKRLF